MVLAIPRTSLSERLMDPCFAARFYRSLAVFLAHRMRNTVARLGYGRGSPISYSSIWEMKLIPWSSRPYPWPGLVSIGCSGD